VSADLGRARAHFGIPAEGLLQGSWPHWRQTTLKEKRRRQIARRHSRDAAAAQGGSRAGWALVEDENESVLRGGDLRALITPDIIRSPERCPRTPGMILPE
jgi:hypothetical protein